MKAANFDVAFNAKDETTLNAYAAQIIAALNTLGRYDLKIEIIFGTDPFGESPDFVNDPNGFRIVQNSDSIFDIYTPTEKQVEGDASDAFVYASWAEGEAPWGKTVSDSDVAEIADHLNAAIPRVGRKFDASDVAMLQDIADNLNSQLLRSNARVIVTDIEEDDRRLMFVGWDLSANECTDDYGYFIELPYTDEEGTSETYSVHYAGYPHPDDNYSFSSTDIDALAAELEDLDVA